MILEQFGKWLFIGISVMIMTACGGDSNVVTANENTWDQMKWDQGIWK